MKTKEHKDAKLVLIQVIAIIVLLLIILFSSIFYIRSSRPLRQAKAEATELAQKYADVIEVDGFYSFTREETYFTIAGKTKKDQAVLVVIPKSGEKISVFDQTEGVTKAEAEAVVKKAFPNEAIRKTSFGFSQKEPVWEVMTTSDSGSNYYLVSFKKGEITKQIQNI